MSDDERQRPQSGRTRKPSEDALYQQRLEAGECTRGCGRDAVDGDQYCIECGVKVRAVKAAGMRSLRALRRRKRRCAYCGRRSSKRRCPACSRKRRRGGGRAPMGVVREARIAVDAAIAARPAPDIAARTRTGADGRTRYHGRSRRGAPSKLQTDEWDLRAIEVEISRARADLIAYWSPENQALPPIQRDAARRSQLGHLELVQRFVDDLVERTRKGLR